MKKKAIFMTYGSPPPSNNHQQPQQSRWIWRCNEGSGNSNNNWRSNNQGCQGQGQGHPTAPRPQLCAYDENCMDTSAVVRKASSDKEKEEYRKEGHCYECGKQGHLVCDCPNCKNRQQQQPHARVNKVKKPSTNLIEFDDDDGSTTDTPETLSVAAQVLRFSEKEHDKFMDYM
jgi:hypothetical protein